MLSRIYGHRYNSCVQKILLVLPKCEIIFGVLSNYIEIAIKKRSKELIQKISEEDYELYLQGAIEQYCDSTVIISNFGSTDNIFASYISASVEICHVYSSYIPSRQQQTNNGVAFKSITEKVIQWAYVKTCKFSTHIKPKASFESPANVQSLEMKLKLIPV